MKTIFANVNVPYSKVGVKSVSIGKMDICYHEDSFLRLEEGGESHDNCADAKGTVISLLKEGGDEVVFSFELARDFYRDHISKYTKSEIRDFLEECFKEADKESDWDE